MHSRREVLMTSGIGLATGLGAASTAGASRQSESSGQCDDCLEIVQDTDSNTVTVMSAEDGYYEYVVDKEAKTVSVHETDETPDEQRVEALTSDQDFSTLSAHEDIIDWYDAWSGSIGTNLGTTQMEYGVAFTAGEDLSRYSGGLLGGAICSIIGIGSGPLGVITGAGCGLLASIVFDGNSDGDEATVGLWDDTGGFLGEPYVRFGGEGGHHFSHEDLSVYESFPGMINWYT